MSEYHPRLPLAAVRALPGAAVRGMMPVVRSLPTRAPRFARRAELLRYRQWGPWSSSRKSASKTK